MGNLLREGRSCSEEIYLNRRDDMLREFQQNRKSVSFLLEAGKETLHKRLNPSFGTVPDLTKLKDPERRPSTSRSQNLALGNSESSSCRLMPKSNKLKVPEKRETPSFGSQYLTIIAPSTSVSESSRYDRSCSLIVTPYSADEEIDFCEIERVLPEVNDRPEYAECIKRKVNKQDTDEERNVPTIDIASYDEGNLTEEVSSPVRVRGKAIDVTTLESPGGKFQYGKKFYLQNAGGTWEIVTIENWNHWSGTWQVRGADGTAFPAAPIALKTEEEYGFLSRERLVRARSFKSFAEKIPSAIKLSKV